MVAMGAPEAVAAPAEPAAGVSGEVLRGVLVVALAVVPLLFGLPHDRVSGEALLPLMAWPLLGLAGLVVLDRHPGSRRGWACVLAAPLPCLAVGLVALGGRAGASPGAEEFAAAADTLGPWPLLALALPLAAPPDTAGPGAARSARRWRLWTSLVAVATVALAGAAWWWGSPTAYGVLAALGVGALAALVVTSTVGQAPRPVLEPLLDALLVLVVLAAAGVTGALVLAFARAERIVAPEAVGALAAIGALALATPTALWARRDLARRRYGTGSLSAQDVDAINRVLGAADDPRSLLDHAADLVAGLSGVADARLLLDEADLPGWTAFPLAVADCTVGTLLIRPADPEGLEQRQVDALRQVLPTLALGTRAVALAVDAEHARSDTARLREQERARILADLHDDLGPVLAGMGMRVEALRAADPSPELAALAAELAGCRSELRRIVEGLAPPALAEHDLPVAVTRLVQSFAHHGSPRVRAVTPVPPDVPPRTAAVVYRIVAEGIANAVRHGHPTHVEVAVRRRAGGVEVEVRDDGRAGARVVPGTGLTSLRHRAEQVGGTLRVVSLPGRGTTLSASLPEVER